MGAFHVRFVNSETKKCGKVFSSYLPTLTEAAAAEAAAVLEEAARRAREARTEEERADAVRRKQWILEQQMASSSGGDEGDDGSTSMSTSDSVLMQCHANGRARETRRAPAFIGGRRGRRDLERRAAHARTRREPAEGRRETFICFQMITLEALIDLNLMT